MKNASFVQLHGTSSASDNTKNENSINNLSNTDNSENELIINELIENCLPMIRRLVKGASRYSITIGGSRGKNLSDGMSDVDFRLYADEFAEGDVLKNGRADVKKHMDYWLERGYRIDGVWMRKISDIDGALNKWLSGDITADPLVWTVWGYYLPTDIYNQQIIEDPHGVAEDWKKRMTPYPKALGDAVIKKHMESLNYWKDDYHYRQKVDRKDAVFLASLSARLVHDIMQVLCAVNGVYFPGDGHNISTARHFAIKPDNFENRIETILYPNIVVNISSNQVLTNNRVSSCNADEDRLLMQCNMQYSAVHEIITDIGNIVSESYKTDVVI